MKKEITYQIRKCPFCGFFPNVERNYLVRGQIESYKLVCCAVQFGSFRTKEKLIERWNERFYV